MRPLAVVTGVGPGTGASVVRRFHEGGYQVAMLARNAERLAGLEGELPHAFAVPCDVSEYDALNRALLSVEDRAGAPKVVVHNAVGGAFHQQSLGRGEVSLRCVDNGQHPFGYWRLRIELQGLLVLRGSTRRIALGFGELPGGDARVGADRRVFHLLQRIAHVRDVLR